MDGINKQGYIHTHTLTHLVIFGLGLHENVQILLSTKSVVHSCESKTANAVFKINSLETPCLVKPCEEF